MRRILLAVAVTVAIGATTALTGLAGGTINAEVKNPVPVGVSNGSNGVCVGAFYWVPQCTGPLA